MVGRRGVVLEAIRADVARLELLDPRERAPMHFLPPLVGVRFVLGAHYQPESIWPARNGNDVAAGCVGELEGPGVELGRGVGGLDDDDRGADGAEPRNSSRFG